MRRALPLTVAALLLLLGCSDDDEPTDGASDGAAETTAEAVDDDEAPRVRESLEDTEFDHWHVTIDAYRCTEYARRDAPFLDVLGDPVGIHTHNDNVIHIHPFVDEAAGRNARFQHFLDDAAVEVTDDSVTFPDDEVWNEADGCEGGPAELVLAIWNDARAAADGGPPDEVLTDDLGSARFAGDGQAFVIALVPEGSGDALPAPPFVVERLTNLTDI
jgi:hypothetical protein